jgi:hypothetical protein
MTSDSFIAGMNALQKELDGLPTEVVRLIETLPELVDVQHGNILTLLAANKHLLGVIDRLKG